VALSGAPAKLDFLSELHADCTFMGYVTVRTLVPPSHGTLTFEEGSDFTSFLMNNQRFDCNKQKSPGTLVKYQSDPGYIGSDSAKIEIFYPDASLDTITYRLKVGVTPEQQGAKDVLIARATLSGSTQKLDFQYAANPDCSSLGKINVRVVKSPSHGTLKVEEGEDYTDFAKGNPRYDCNKKKLPGSLVYYQPEGGIAGRDSAQVEAAYPTGAVKSISYDIYVR